MEVEGSHCIRTEQDETTYDREPKGQIAKSECSKNRRCIGIESFFHPGRNEIRFKICLDSIYKNMASDNYTELANQLFKKVESNGKCTAHTDTFS